MIKVITLTTFDNNGELRIRCIDDAILHVTLLRSHASRHASRHALFRLDDAELVFEAAAEDQRTVDGRRRGDAAAHRHQAREDQVHLHQTHR